MGLTWAARVGTCAAMAAVRTRVAAMVALSVAGLVLLAAGSARAACCLCFDCDNPAAENTCAQGVAFDAGAFAEAVCKPLGCELAQCSGAETCEVFADCQPLGACCGRGDACTEISEPGCRPLGGTFRGDGTFCDSACEIARPVPAVSFLGTVAIAVVLLAFGAVSIRRVSALRRPR